jgi:predicted transposase/invertase (TIGR01784 family)
MKITTLKHDELFRSALSHPKAAQEFLDTHLPDSVKSILNLNHIKMEKDSFIEETLKESICDILLSVATNDNKQSFIYCLIEQQSKPERFMAFRMMKYMIAICDKFLKNNPKNKYLPLIYPIVFYSGKSHYNAPTKLSDLYHNKDLAEEILVKGYQLIDLDKIPDEIIKQKRWLGMIEMFMKHIKDRNLLDLWNSVVEFLPEITKEENGLNYVVHFIAYTLTSMDKDDKINLEKLLTNNLGDKSGEETVASIAQAYFDEGKMEGKMEGEHHGIIKGRMEGRVEGRVEGKREVVLNLLKQKAPIDLITTATGFSVKEIEALKNT